MHFFHVVFPLGRTLFSTWTYIYIHEQVCLQFKIINFNLALLIIVNAWPQPALWTLIMYELINQNLLIMSLCPDGYNVAPNIHSRKSQHTCIDPLVCVRTTCVCVHCIGDVTIYGVVGTNILGWRLHDATSHQLIHQHLTNFMLGF